MVRKPTINVVSVEDFGQKFACEISTLPGNVVLLLLGKGVSLAQQLSRK
jgi:hypothetical protein